MIPMLARTYGPKYDKFPCFVQPKLNGVRALYQAGVMQSRDEKFFGRLAHLTTALKELNLDPNILDGELYVPGWSLQQINGAVAVNSSQPRHDTHLVQFHVFDIVSVLPFSERWLAPYNVLRNLDHPLIRAVPTALCQDRNDMLLHFHSYTRQGFEGIMLRPDGPYELGETDHGTTKRSQFLWKHKQWQDGEFTCVDTTPGEGKANIGIGSLRCVDPKHVYACGPSWNKDKEFGVGTGFTDSDRIFYAQNPPIGKLVKIRYLELTADGIPFNPSFLAVL